MIDFRCIAPQNILDNPSYLEVFKLAFGPFTDMKLKKVLAEYEQGEGVKIYGIFQEEVVVAIIGYQILKKRLTIKQIAVATPSQRLGLGRKIIEKIIETETPISLDAETDDDAVQFYRKLGFSCKSFVSPQGYLRYSCVRHNS